MSVYEQAQSISGCVGAGVPSGYGEKLAGYSSEPNRPRSITEDVPNVEDLLNAHLGTIDYLNDRLELLIHRLGPILEQAPETACSNSALTARSGLGNVISSATARLQSAGDRIQNTLNRLDI